MKEITVKKESSRIWGKVRKGNLFSPSCPKAGSGTIPLNSLPKGGGVWWLVGKSLVQYFLESEILFAAVYRPVSLGQSPT